MLISTLPEYQAQKTIKLYKSIGGNDVSPFGAFARGCDVKLTARFPATAGAYDFNLEITADADGSLRVISFERNFKAQQEEYSLSLPTEAEGLFFYRISYRDDSGKHYVINDVDGTSDFQLTVYSEEYEAPRWFRGGTMYQIFVDRFNRGGNPPKKDYAKMAKDVHDIPQFPVYPGAPLANDMFFGGDLDGVTAKLDYLKSIGVSTVYLCPIFEAHSNHKYDTGDYSVVDSMFGGDEALDRLLSAAKVKGLRIILDGVFNHTGDDSIYFNKYGNYPSVGAYQSKESPYYTWYTFEDYPDRYKSWWGIPILPTVNKDSAEFRDYIFGEEGIIKKYLKKGIDGWRLDVADELPEEFLRPLCQRAKKTKKDAFIIGEVWEDASNKIAYDRRRKYLQGHELDSVMNYPWRNAVIDFIKGSHGELLRRAVMSIYSHYPKCVSDNLMNFLGTHDTPRILTVLGGEAPDGYSNAELSTKTMSAKEREKALQMLKCAYAIIATLPGVPCIYYGDEAGMEGYGDPFNRRYYPWGEEDTDLVDFFAKVGRIRCENSEFAEGVLRFDEIGERHITYLRNGVFIAVNAGPEAVTVNAPKGVYDMITDSPFDGTLPPMSAVICK